MKNESRPSKTESVRNDKRVWRDFNDDPDNSGNMRLAVERTAENYHHFLYNLETNSYELNNKGSANIVDTLQGLEDSLVMGITPMRRVSFFDKDFTFYNQAMLAEPLKIYEADEKKLWQKHTVTFNFDNAGGSTTNLKFRIEDICSLEYALPQSP